MYHGTFAVRKKKTVLLPRFHSSFRRIFTAPHLRCTQFVEFTIGMDKSKVLFYLFAILAFHCFSRCIIELVD